MERPDAWHLTEDLHVQHGQADPFSAAIRATRMPMIVTDPLQTDNPIIFANDAFLALTGYARAEVNGQNCRFLQGPKTDPEAIRKIRDAISNRQDISVDILNYRKDGSTFWNALYLSPVSNADGIVQYFFASQVDATERKELELRAASQQSELERLVKVRTKELEDALAQSAAIANRFETCVKLRTQELEQALATSKLLVHEVDHRVKNNLQMISAMLMMQSLRISDQKIKNTLQEMLERIEAMGLVHKRLYQADNIMDFDLGDFTNEIASNLVAASGRTDIKLVVETVSVNIQANNAASIALIVNETITNALKHGFASGRSGQLRVSVRSQRDACEINIEDDGHGLSVDGEAKKGFGRVLIETLIQQLRATIEWLPGLPGTRVKIVLPIA